LFADAARGLFAVVVPNLSEVQTVQERSFDIRGGAIDYLLFDWLNELLYTFDTQHLVLCEYELRVTDQGLQATCRGETLDTDRHTTGHEVKAITYHGLRVERHASEWLAEVILDI
jgi:SHS2 domain-containing protein